MVQKARRAGTSGDCMAQTPAVCSALSCAFQGPVRSCYFQSERSHRTNCSNPFFVLVFFFSCLYHSFPYLDGLLKPFAPTAVFLSPRIFVEGVPTSLLQLCFGKNSWIPLSHLFSRLQKSSSFDLSSSVDFSKPPINDINSKSFEKKKEWMPLSRCLYKCTNI